MLAPNLTFYTSSARGNTSLESAVSLTKQLRWEIQELGQRLQVAATAEELFQRRSAKAQEMAQHALELKQIAQAIRKLLSKIEDAVPLINLAITASGASLSSNLPSTISPSRLLQASTFLTAGDSQYAHSTTGYMQIGPTFIFSLYMLFSGHIRAQNEDDVRNTTWKEVVHKAVVRLMRVPLDSAYALPGVTKPEQAQSDSSKQGLNGRFSNSPTTDGARADEFAYQLVIVEDLNDDRAHTFEDDEPQPGPYSDIDMAGIREVLPIHEISKIFYADTGKILNIGSEGEANNPVLLLKRDLNAIPPRRAMTTYGEAYGSDETRSSVPQSPSTSSYGDSIHLHPSSKLVRRSGSLASTPPQQQLTHAAYPWRLPADLDPEWMAFEVYIDADDSDTETEDENTPSTKTSRPSRPSSLPATTSALSRLDVNSSNSPSLSQTQSPDPQQLHTPALPPIRTSLSLLEMLLRLTSLQQFQQTPHLSIPDELLTFFLSESASTGAASNDAQERKRLREEARRRVGFDPYDESPVKRRGEEYQYRSGEAGGSEPWDAEGGREFTDEPYGSPIGSVRYDGSRYEDEGYNTRSTTIPPSSNDLPFTPGRAATDSPAERWFRNLPPRDATSTSSSPLESRRPPPIARRSDSGRYWLRESSDAVAGKKGSPLARSGIEVTDEGLGTSPGVEKGRNG